MADYTPTADDVHNEYVYGQLDRATSSRITAESLEAEFDRWLAQERATAQQAVRAQLAAQYTARAAQARTTSAAFAWQQAARIARGGEDQ